MSPASRARQQWTLPRQPHHLTHPSLMKEKNKKCPAQSAAGGRPGQPATVVVRTERRSWITLVITGFGALLLRYLKTVRERGHTVRKP